MIFVKFKFDLCSDAFRVTSKSQCEFLQKQKSTFPSANDNNQTIIRNCEKGFYPVYRHAVDANPFWGDDVGG